MSIIPAAFVFSNVYQKILKWIYIITNSVFLILNCIDFVYFKFTNKRSGYDIFNQIFGGQTDVLKQIPDYIKDFWLVFLIYFAIVYLLFLGWKKIKLDRKNNFYIYTFKNAAAYSGLFFFMGALLLLGMRGGFQYIPLQIVDAGKYASPKNVALVLNTPFSIIRSFDSERLPDLQFEKNEDALAYIKPVKQYPKQNFLKKNIVVLILESFSKEYTGIGKRKSLTPFLDSLMKKSLLFTNGWANGKQSIEGIPAILSSVPSFMNTPFVNSKYADNRLNSFPSLLKEKGYTTAFFHGGKNGTMNFDSYANIAGFESYYGMNEYPNEEDFDGNWGIWDEPFLQYCSKKFTDLQQPFLASVFTLSSHHPYKVPEQYQNKFPATNLEISESVGYADMALRKFFESAEKTDWYKNTVFVLVPDHTGPSADFFYGNQVGQHAIPIAFYSPEKLFSGTSDALMQQCDILPTLLDTLGYNDPFFSFGKSAFQKHENEYAIFYDSGNHYLVQDSMCFIFNNYVLKQSFLYKRDSSLQNECTKKYSAEAKKAEKYFRNFLQLYHYTLNSNTAFAEDR